MTTAVAPDLIARARARRPLELAALGVAAVPGMRPVSVVATRPTRDGVDTAVVRDDASRHWVVAAPRRGAAGVEIEAEVAVLSALAGRTPFEIPEPTGHALLPGGGRAMVFRALAGTPLALADLATTPGLAAAVGRAMAAVHALEVEGFLSVGVPFYDGEALRRRCLATLDRGAEPGIVPPSLLDRWESRIEDVTRWRFLPCPVHGELLADRVLVHGPRVAAIIDWSGARVSDPAEDLAWLAVGADPDSLTSVVEAYGHARGGGLDRHVVDRAVLHGEMALITWLLHGLRGDDEHVVEDASAMLAQLAAWHEEHTDEAPAPPPGSVTQADAARSPDPDPGRSLERSAEPQVDLAASTPDAGPEGPGSTAVDAVRSEPGPAHIASGESADDDARAAADGPRQPAPLDLDHEDGRQAEGEPVTSTA